MKQLKLEKGVNVLLTPYKTELETNNSSKNTGSILWLILFIFSIKNNLKTQKCIN